MNQYRVDRSWATTPEFYTAPHPEQVVPKQYQHAAVEYRLSVPNGRNGMIGDAPGLGKTAEGVLVSNAMEAGRTLVTCPASLILNWEREIWTWSTIPNVRTYPVLASRNGVSDTADYVITSTDMLRNKSIHEALLDMRFDHWIIDEAHSLKDPKGNQRTKVMCAPDMLPSVAGAITPMSGTFMPNQPIEVYNVMRLCDPDSVRGMSVEAFRDYFYEEGAGFITRFNHETGEYEVAYSEKVRNQPVHLAELNEMMRSSLMVRRLKEDVLHELPPKQWHPFPIQVSSEVRRAMANPAWKQVERLYDLDPDAFDISAPIDGMVSTAMRELGEAMAPVVAAYIEDLLMSGVDKVVVGAWHHSVLDVLRERLDRYGLVYMDGRNTVRQKQHSVDEFQTRDDVRIILGQIQVLGEGWTLTKAQDAVFAEFFWVPGKNDQLLDRIHRLGQKGDYIIGHLPFVPGTISERVVGVNVKKSQHIYQAMDARK